MSRSKGVSNTRIRNDIPYTEAMDVWDHLGVSIVGMSKLRIEIETSLPFDKKTYLMADMENLLDTRRVAELEPWMVERLSLLYLVHDHTNVPGVGYRYNDRVFYIETDPTYYEQKDTEA